jgi:hypothetical protein
LGQLQSGSGAGGASDRNARHRGELEIWQQNKLPQKNAEIAKKKQPEFLSIHDLDYDKREGQAPNSCAR